MWCATAPDDGDPALAPARVPYTQAMTRFECLIQIHIEAPQPIRLNPATEKIAEEMARELLDAPGVRAELRALARTLAKQMRRRQRKRSPR
jgi:hypothetical protein